VHEPPQHGLETIHAKVNFTNDYNGSLIRASMHSMPANACHIAHLFCLCCLPKMV